MNLREIIKTDFLEVDREMLDLAMITVLTTVDEKEWEKYFSLRERSAIPFVAVGTVYVKNDIEYFRIFREAVYSWRPLSKNSSCKYIHI